jgi:L-ascorbate metabolism protein UlaG (beta-lactamase superfamily)
MKLTKYAQSCVLTEDLGKNILIDPGEYSDPKELAEIVKKADVILVTHKHGDHFNEAIVKANQNPNTKIYSTAETAAFYPNTKFEIIKAGDIITLGNTKIEVAKAVHGYNPFLKGEKEVHEAIGYILDNQKKKIYHTGDTICFPNNYKCNAIMLPYNDHGLCMGPFEAAMFAKETVAELVIPIHSESPKFPADKTKFEEELKKNNLKYKFLQIGESIEI